MRRFLSCMAVALVAAVAAPDFAKSEILAMMNYETKPADSLKELNLSTPRERKEGIAIIDVDPNSPAFGKILVDIPLPPDLVAHHVGLTRDGRYAFVQNSFINLPGMRDGSVTVIDLKKQEVVATMDTLKKMDFNPNSLVLLPKWNDMAGH